MGLMDLSKKGRMSRNLMRLLLSLYMLMVCTGYTRTMKHPRLVFGKASPRNANKQRNYLDREGQIVDLTP